MEDEITGEPYGGTNWLFLILIILIASGLLAVSIWIHHH